MPKRSSSATLAPAPASEPLPATAAGARPLSAAAAGTKLLPLSPVRKRPRPLLGELPGDPTCGPLPAELPPPPPGKRVYDLRTMSDAEIKALCDASCAGLDPLAAMLPDPQPRIPVRFPSCVACACILSRTPCVYKADLALAATWCP